MTTGPHHRAGGLARAAKLSPARRSAIATKAATARWGGGLRAAVSAALARDNAHRPTATTVIIALPMPPSVNALFADGKTRRHLSRAYVEWRREAGTVLNLARLPRVAGPYVVELDLAADTGMDADNAAKPIIDLLVQQGVTDDDRDLRELHIRKTFAGAGLVSVVVRAYPSNGAVP
jgi:Holliday junction resolvase RusA-like endonuclease